MALNYTEQLQDPRWLKKSEEIKELDGNKCLICGDSEHYLYVHHICYLPDTLAWEYDDELLKTVCRKHHEMLTYDLPKLAGLIAWHILACNLDPFQIEYLIKLLKNIKSNG